MREKSLGKRDQITLVLKLVQTKYDPTHTLNFRESECQKKKTLLLKISFTIEKKTVKENNFQR